VRRAALLLAVLLLVACGRVPAGTANTSTGPSVARTANPPPAVSPSPTCGTATQPSPRADASMAYMPTLDQVILFGGATSSAFLGDTWIWHGGSWTQLASPGPSPRMDLALAYDPLRKVVIGFGGRTDPSLQVFSRETWSFNGSIWALVAANGPDLQSSWATFDENSQQVLLFGSKNGGAQTWSWDGVQWRQLPVSSPPARQSSAMAFDPGSRRIIVFGGIGLSPMTNLNDTWAWNGSTWSELAPPHRPSPRSGAALASYQQGHEMLLVGGISPGIGINVDAWIWNGSDWTPTPAPSPRANAAAVDVGTGVLIFGGDGATSQLDDTVVWDGATWTCK
jgi:hypothetical protein